MHTEIQLTDGTAANMGDGHFLILQTDETGAAHSVFLSRGDLEALLADQA